jgi:cold shock protein
MNGTVKWFNTQKGFGFIKGEDGNDYFVHYKQLPEGTRLNENDAVTFDAVETERGKQAQNVNLGSEESAPEEEAPAEEAPEEEAPAEEAEEEPEKPESEE